jgi:outer membrane protein assembly factor BamA
VIAPESLLDSVLEDDGDSPPIFAPPSNVGRKRSPTLRLGDQVDYFTRRFEPAGFPLIGGDSDIGFEFGGVGTLSYFADGVKPYRWNMDLLLAMSIKGGPTGAEVAQTNFLWQLDAPDVLGPGRRLNPEVAYSRTVNYGYFGLGNASSGVTPPLPAATADRYHEWIDSVAQVRSGLRVGLRGPIAALFAAQYLYVGPTAYAGSLLASDAARTNANGSPYIYGTSGTSLPSLAAGFLYDSRDDEVFPTRGMLHELGVRAEMGFPTSSQVRYLEAGGIWRGYVPLGPLVLAGRLVTNFQIGNVPFFDLFQAGPFDQKEMLGGSAGIRGVPVGRYLGPIKILGNIELRAMVFQFTVLRQKFTLGADTFFDTGRVWSDYTFHSPLDGSGIGLKYGVGGGLYILWGQAAMLRIEAAYSPDAVSENPTLPVGIYVNDNVMF